MRLRLKFQKKILKEKPKEEEDDRFFKQVYI